VNNKTRLLTALTAAALVLALLGSACFIVHNADHDCTGEDCFTCRVLALCAAALRGLTVIVCVTAAALSMNAAAARDGRFSAPAAERCTPVTLRVKLSN